MQSPTPSTVAPGLIREHALGKEQWQAIASRSFVPLTVDSPRGTPFSAHMEGGSATASCSPPSAPAGTR